jgi:ferritin
MSPLSAWRFRLAMQNQRRFLTSGMPSTSGFDLIRANSTGEWLNFCGAEFGKLCLIRVQNERLQFMPGIPIKPTVLAEIQRQFNHELGAAQGYLAMALWCEDQNFKGFARYFRKQVAEEREHADKFMAHLIARGVLPELQALAAPKTQFASLLDVARTAQQMEQVNTAGVNQVFEAALESKDYPAQVMVQWFINEQVEEEAWTDEMVARVERAACAGSLMDLDRHLEKILGEVEQAS